MDGENKSEWKGTKWEIAQTEPLKGTIRVFETDSENPITQINTWEIVTENEEHFLLNDSIQVEYIRTDAHLGLTLFLPNYSPCEEPEDLAYL